MIGMRRTDICRQIYPRTERFYTKGCYWYFKTREDKEYGPFSTQEEAFQELRRFLQFRVDMDDIRARWNFSNGSK